MNGAQAMVRELEALGVRRVFGYPGGAIMPFYDALIGSGLEHILVRHEQGAAFAANGYARASGQVGVCVATSGPGATNLVTGIADAFMDSVPLVAITGQVPLSALGTDAFQEVDILGMTLPIVKHSILLESADEVRSALREAFAIASSGRPGPVLIDFPKDVSIAECRPDEGVVSCEVEEGQGPGPTEDAFARACELIAQSERPVVLAGGGIGKSGAVEDFRSFVERNRLPTVTTLHGVGSLPTGHEWLLGMLGMHGNPAANHSVQESDLLICIGARFDDRATGRLDRFAPQASVIHMEIDPSEIDKVRRAHVSLLGDLKQTVSSLKPRRPDVEPWRALAKKRQSEHAWRYDAPGSGVYGPAFIRDLTAAYPECTLVSDVGQHQMWVAQHGVFTHPRRHLSSGGLGAMGFSLPAAMGAQFAHPSAPVVSLAGDGSFMMNVQELATLKRHNIPVKIVVFDNSSLGLVRQWQECFFEDRRSETDLSDNPDFVSVAQSFGIPGERLERAEETGGAIQRLMEEPGPRLLQVLIDVRANVWPLVPPNRSNSEMIDGVPSCGTA